ncbi:nucleotide-binding protein [Vibrio parahaemolyticus]|nr:nucleotide-binding protein [Vibrio parahaemolyticus]EJG0303433.1 nucleotide-binding protein [Vibrio parahaemolyticus]EJG0516847.1 nucleotide-binding protein [Vibrio parahaemolyticus]
MRKPRVFIGSSVESLPIADAIAENLEFDAEVTIWRNGTFNLSSNALDDLITKAKSVDFSVFIFSPDDLTIMRSREKYVVRDNVVFELGLFIGAIGKNRCFIVKPRDVELHFPSDLLGITPTDFDANRSDDDLASSLNYSATQIKRAFKDQGLLELDKVQEKPRIDVNAQLASLNDTDMIVLSVLLESINSDVDGCASWDLYNRFDKYDRSSAQINLAIIKLIRSGMIEKLNTSDFNGNEYFSYNLTEYGIDVCLSNQERIETLTAPKKRQSGWGVPQQPPVRS